MVRFLKSDIFILLVLSSISALLWTLAFFPGGLSPDTIQSWGQAHSGNYNDHHPVIMALLMRPFAVLGLPIHFYTLIQSFVFFGSSFLLIREIISALPFGEKRKIFLFSILFFSAVPIHWVYSVTVWKDVLITIFANGLGIALIRFWTLVTWRRFSIALAFLVLTVLARHNAILLLPALTVHFFAFRKHYKFSNRMKYGLVFGGLIVLTSGKILNSFMQVQSAGLGTLVYASQYLGYERQLVKHTGLSSENAPEFWNAVIAGDNGYQRIVEKKDVCGDEWLFVMDPTFNSSQLGPHSATIPFGVPGLLAKFVLSHPLSALRHHLCVLDDLLSGRRNFFFYGVSENEWGYSFKPKSNSLNGFAVTGINKQNETIFRAHYPQLLILLALLLLSFRSPNPVISTIPFIGVGYFLGFCLVPQLDWRYLFLSYVQCWALCLPYAAHFAITYFHRRFPRRTV